MSDSDQQQHQQMRHHHHLLADGPSYYMMNDGGTGNVMIGNGGGGGGVGDGGSSSYVDHHDVVPEVYIPQPELLTRMPTSELRYILVILRRVHMNKMKLCCCPVAHCCGCTCTT